MMRSSLLVAIALAIASNRGLADPTLADYRYFRALSIDLQGRPPTRSELHAFEQPGFDLARWIDARLTEPAYAARIRRIYMDLLRLELPESIQYKPGPVNLRGVQILGPSGRRIWLYYRPGQRRRDPALDAQVCFTPEEIGVKVPVEGKPIGTLKPVARAVFEARTVAVKPWWLYADYRAAKPIDRLSPDWARRFGLELEPRLFVEPETTTPLTEVRVCREEAQTAPTGTVYVSGRLVRDRDPVPPGRLTRPPGDSRYARAHPGQRVSCLSSHGFRSSVECGCGIGLERCLPSAPAGFMTITDAPLGTALPFNKSGRPAHLWMMSWLAQEPVHYLDQVLREDRDFRDVLTGRGTVINGPLALFYRTLASAQCCDGGTGLDYVEPDPLFDPAAVPADLVPHDVARWVEVRDRGPHAAGLLTMPVFLRKFATARQRAHAVYSAFLCRDFVAEHAKLRASSEVDLTRRPGCRACHIRLEPMAAYFARIEDQDWSYLPRRLFPAENPACAAPMAATCRAHYDPTFSDRERGMLRNAYAAPAHADLGPAGLAAEITRSPEFASCVARNVSGSLLGRALTPADEPWLVSLAKTFVEGGYRMRALVRAVVTSPQYRGVP